MTLNEEKFLSAYLACFDIQKNGYIESSRIDPGYSLSGTKAIAGEPIREPAEHRSNVSNKEYFIF